MASLIHLHNGDVMAARAQRVGLPGEHVPYREALIAGPVRSDDQWLESRARFLAGVRGDELLRTSNRLFEQEQLLTAASAAAEIVLWFEHDLFCLVHFVYLLQRLPTGRTFFVWHEKPLTDVEPDELLHLYNRKRAVTRDMAATARKVWQAYTAPNPLALSRLEVPPTEFPFLIDGLRLHCARFPSVTNGLGTVEQHILEFIADGATDFGALFNRFWSSNARFGFGDTEVLRHLHALAGKSFPLITLIEGSESQVSFTITEQGEQVLAGRADDVTLNGIDWWLGGAHLTDEKLWRWDDRRKELIESSRHEAS